MSYDSISGFVRQQKEWLQAELNSDEEGHEEGLSSRLLRGLVAQNVSVGLFGRTVVELGVSNDEKRLPAHKFSNGDEVDVRKKERYLSGVVCRVSEESISIALQKPDEEGLLEEESLSVLPTSSVMVHSRMTRALDELEKAGDAHPVAGRVIARLFSKPSPSTKQPLPPLDPINQNLDSSQVDAVRLALSDENPITLIHGPPGTGKTTTLVEYISSQVLRGSRLLVCAPSNVAVDNLLERLDKKIRCVRMGHPARLSPSILQRSLEALVNAADGTEIVHDVREELQSLLKMLPKTRNKAAIYREAKSLRKEIKMRQGKVVDELLKNAQVVLSTCVGAANSLLRDHIFDVVVIDEAAQALEAACWIPILHGKRLVLAGDHKQLPPTIKCNDPKVSKGLERTMFERLMEMDPDENISRMLKIQYRMNQKISDWASQALYHGRLLTHGSVASRTLASLTEKHDENDPMLLIDTAGCDMYEKVNHAGSRYNEGEAMIVKEHVEHLLELGVRPEEIAIISPYNGQVEILKLSLLPIAPKLEIRSVDGFQGGEREAVVLSLVRSSEKGGIDGIGFLRDDRRLNVAVTRAKRHVCLVCDSDTVCQSEFVRNLVSWVTEHGDTKSALEYVHSDKQSESDLAFAERELDKLRISFSTNSGSKKKPNEQFKKDKDRRNELEKMIRGFVSSGRPGDTMPLSATLSSFDRRMIHEIAEKLQIKHSSEGKEGVDRRIVLAIPDAVEHLASGLEDEEEIVSPLLDMVEGIDKLGAEDIPSVSRFVEDSEGGSESDEERLPSALKHSDPLPEENGAVDLAALAKEREKREIEKWKAQLRPEAFQAGTHCKQQKPAKGQRLGGKQKIAQRQKEKPSEDDLDDMAFLDAQIKSVQTAHGRRIDGKGSSYQTIMNGFLTQKPQPQGTKKDPRKTAALQTKLKQAQDSRKPKAKKRK